MSIESEIRSRITNTFSPTYIELVNESHMHSVPENSETHFKLVLVCDEFEGMRKVARHQKIYALTSDLMEKGLHALALHLFTEAEWQTQQHSSLSSPNCMGGSKRA